MPCKAMQKVSVRQGDMFWCGWLPPAGKTDAGFMFVLGVGL